MISAIILAAGQSKRFGSDNKLIKKYNKKHLINHILDTLIKSKIKKIIIVSGFQNSKVKKIIVKNKKINFVYNKNYKFGMASSIKTGLKRIPNKNIGFLIIHADMPKISRKIINKLYEAIKSKDKEIFVPTYKRKLGNPVGFKYCMLKSVKKIAGDRGAKKIIKRNKKKLYLIKVNSKSIFNDLNTPRDFLNN